MPLYYQGHAYRTGSRIRVTIAAPGGDQPVWAFADASPRKQASVTVARSSSMPSRLLLPVVDGIAVPTGLPPCPGLRGEPCRPYARVNRPVTVGFTAARWRVHADDVEAARWPLRGRIAKLAA